MSDYKQKIDLANKLFKIQGFEKKQDLAKEMGLLPNTLTSNLKYIIKNERFETSFARKLFRVLNVSKDEFVVSLNKEIEDDAKSSISIIENRSELLKKIADAYQSEITNLISNLGNESTYTLITTENPWEFENFFIRDVILSAIKRGVSFRYIYPDVTTETKEIFKKYEDKLQWRGLKNLHEAFIEEMLSKSKSDKEFLKIDEYKTNPKEFINENLKAYFTEETMLVHPRLKSMLIETKIKGQEKVFAFSEATFGESFLNENNKPNTIWYPLPNNDKILLENIINKIVHE